LKLSHKGDYKVGRSKVYPPIEDYLDAQIKINSRDPVLVKEGKEQFDTYIKVCLQIKKNYPKIKKA